MGYRVQGVAWRKRSRSLGLCTVLVHRCFLTSSGQIKQQRFRRALRNESQRFTIGDGRPIPTAERLGVEGEVSPGNVEIACAVGCELVHYGIAGS